MIHGDGVMGKYNVIIAGRQQELYAGISYAQRQTKYDELNEFIVEVRSCTPDEFEQWYQLYRETVTISPPRKRLGAQDD